MGGPENLRAYGLLRRGGRLLVAREDVGPVRARKFPGGGVEPGETPEEALVREFREETGLRCRPRRLLHAPGTLLSPWTGRSYTPLYYAVEAPGEPAAPPGERLALLFAAPADLLDADDVAGPEKVAVRRLGIGRRG